MNVTQEISSSMAARAYPFMNTGAQQVQKAKEKQFYFIFETYKESMLQMINLRGQQNNPFTEQEMRLMTSELIETLADLQRNRIAHRNIKPANIVRLDKNRTSQMNDPLQYQKLLRICNFELAAELY